MPIIEPNSMEFISRNVEQTRRLGMRFGSLVGVGDVIFLLGDLGSGKTTFVQGLAAGWGSLDQVSSPTFVLANVYRRLDGQRLYHLDAYRLRDAAEAEDLDLDAMLEGGPLVVEWAERIQSALPEDRLQIQMRWINDVQRDMVLSAHGQRIQKMLDAIRRQIYGVSG
jgi:tRNA threonylcarbamoyladenosine biosynthesis protein TsaE